MCCVFHSGGFEIYCLYDRLSVDGRPNHLQLDYAGKTSQEGDRSKNTLIKSSFLLVSKIIASW